MANTYLINKATFDGYEDISINIKEERILVFVKKMQDLDLKPFLGHPLFYDFMKWISFTGFGAAKIVTPTTTASDGKYTDQALVTSGDGTGATATFIVLGGKVTSVIQTAPGINFELGDPFTIVALPGAAFSVNSLNPVFIPDTPQYYQDLFNGVEYVDNLGHTIIYEGMIPMLVYFTFARFIEADAVRYTATGPALKDRDNGSSLSVSDTVKLVQQQRSVANAHANEVTKYLYDHKKVIPLWRYDEKNKSSRQSGPRIRGIDKTNFNYPNGLPGYGEGYGDYMDIGGLV